MSEWIGVITNAGEAALEKAVTTGMTLDIDAVKIGTGIVPEVNMRTATALQTQVGNGEIKQKRQEDYGVRFVLNITPLASAYTIKEVGVFGTIDSESVLIALYQNEDGVEVPAVADFPDYSYRLSAVWDIDNLDNLTITVNPSALVTTADLEDALEPMASKEDLEEGLEPKADMTYLMPVINGNKSNTEIVKGNYVLLINSTIQDRSDGLYYATTTIYSANTVGKNDISPAYPTLLDQGRQQGAINLVQNKFISKADRLSLYGNSIATTYNKLNDINEYEVANVHIRATGMDYITNGARTESASGIVACYGGTGSGSEYTKNYVMIMVSESGELFAAIVTGIKSYTAGTYTEIPVSQAISNLQTSVTQIGGVVDSLKTATSLGTLSSLANLQNALLAEITNMAVNESKLVRFYPTINPFSPFKPAIYMGYLLCTYHSDDRLDFTITLTSSLGDAIIIAKSNNTWSCTELARNMRTIKTNSDNTFDFNVPSSTQHFFVATCNNSTRYAVLIIHTNTSGGVSYAEVSKGSDMTVEIPTGTTNTIRLSFPNDARTLNCEDILTNGAADSSFISFIQPS